MIINLSPVRMDEELLANRKGDLLTLNGEVFDFGPLTEGATLPQAAVDCKWFAGPVERVDGALVMTLALPHGADAPETTRFPQPITVTADGPVSLPVHSLVSALGPNDNIDQEPDQ
ncbi:hypothetical protein IAE37_005272 [Pseudomonas sp. S31]|uniref:hypothetical protein n=1 Tax=Pseudomonas sp. S31 TaxID=1564473 RepID=UPI001913D50C|nr:hypothetical protein [Pseudomonas sp. S31]MBK5002996.1 hypothetical protein [Pseudomonas sp. S31]